MDQRDLDVLAAYYARGFDSYEEIGRALGLTGAAVRARLNKMTEEGVLLGCFPRVAGRLVGRVEHIVELAGVTSAMAPERVVAHEEVITSMLDTERMMLVRAFAPAGRRVDAAGIARLAEGRVVHVHPIVEREGAAPVRLTAEERAMLVGILDAPCDPIASVARLTQRTPQAVQRLEDRLVAEGVLGMESLLSLTRASGLFVEAVRVESEGTARELVIEVPTLRYWTRFGESFMLLSGAPSLHDARAVRETIQRAAPGAKLHAWAEAAEDPGKLSTWVDALPDPLDQPHPGSRNRERARGR